MTVNQALQRSIAIFLIIPLLVDTALAESQNLAGHEATSTVSTLELPHLFITQALAQPDEWVGMFFPVLSAKTVNLVHVQESVPHTNGSLAMSTSTGMVAPVTTRTIENLNAHGFDLAQFLSFGHAVYQISENGHRLLFRLRIGTSRSPMNIFNIDTPLQKVGGFTVDIFDLDRNRSQFVGRTDSLIADMVGDVFNMEPKNGTILLDTDNRIADSALLSIYAGDLHPESLIEAAKDHREQHLSGSGNQRLASWIAKDYRNRQQSPTSSYEGVGTLLVFLTCAVSVCLFHSQFSLFYALPSSRQFYLQGGAYDRFDLGTFVLQHDYPIVLDLGRSIHFLGSAGAEGIIQRTRHDHRFDSVNTAA